MVYDMYMGFFFLIGALYVGLVWLQLSDGSRYYSQ